MTVECIGNLFQAILWNKTASLQHSHKFTATLNGFPFEWENIEIPFDEE